MKWMGGPGRFTNSGSIARRLRPPQSKVQLQFWKAHDSRSAGKLLSCLKSGTMLLADRGYDADWITALPSICTHLHPTTELSYPPFFLGMFGEGEMSVLLIL